MGKDCGETLRAIELFLDGELEIDVQERIESHLGGCPPCMDRAEFRRHLKVLIASRCAADDVPPDLVIRIQTLIQEHEAPTA